MGFRRTRVEHLERFEAVDVNRTNNNAWGNLTMALKSFVQPGSGISWGCTFDAPGGMLLTMSAGAVMTDGGPVLFDAPQSLVFAASHASLDRIDIVTTGYAEASGTNEARSFWDDNQQQPFSQPIDTEVISGPSAALVTQGTPAGSPTAPSTPAGHVVLAQVRVNAAVVDLLVTDVTVPSESQLQVVRHSIKYGTFDQNVDVTLPWSSNTNAPIIPPFKMKVDDGRPIFLFGSATIAPQGSAPASIILHLETSVGGPIAQAFYPLCVKAMPTAKGTTLWVASLFVGIGTTEEFILRAASAGSVLMPGNQLIEPASDVTVSRAFIGAIIA